VFPENPNLKAYLQNVINENSLPEEIQMILDAFSLLKLAKNEYLVRENSICNYFCFIESGILQHAISVSGVEKTTYLALKNSCTSALYSFRHKIASRKNIKAISDCELWILTLADFEILLNTNKAFHTFYYNLIENQIYKIDEYRIDLITLSPEERYQKLIENDIALPQKVPLQYLSSLLGISDRHLSRIRKNTLK
jgi:CRP-like cAMP-binding protein